MTVFVAKRQQKWSKKKTCKCDGNLAVGSDSLEEAKDSLLNLL